MDEKIFWFASNNQDKINELKSILEPRGYTIYSLLDLDPPLPAINEDKTSFVENSYLKAETLANYTGQITIGDDSGLEISALNNFPGIYSSRWKGDMSYHEAMLEILKQLEEVEKTDSEHFTRNASFVCALTYFDPIKKIVKTFIGKLEGEITTEIKGQSGFGYDQIFYIPSKHATLGEMSLEEKNKISHRYQAITQLLEFLKTS